MINKCLICYSKVIKTTDEEVVFCERCNHYQYSGSSESKIFDHPELSKSLESLRKKQSKKIVKRLKKLYPSSLHNLIALEVGAGKGFLIRELLDSVSKCYALDMDETYKSDLESCGIEFKTSNLDNQSHFNNVDIILGSHVFEHLKDPNKFLKSVNLNNVTKVIIFVPNSSGWIFSFGKALNKLGISLLWERLFQKNSNSPHYHYFSENSFKRVVENNNFKIIDSFNINMVDYFPNFKRITVTENLIISIISSIALSFLEILNRVFKVCDSKVYYLEKNNRK
jgi:ubiquinone/menaquinone biosynthesis C-methylase UbiE